MAHIFYAISFAVFLVVGVISLFWTPILWSGLLIVPLFVIGVADSLQSKQAVRRNFPLIGNFRYLLEMIRPEINQYFIESNTDGRPFDREMRSVVYRRAKMALQTQPFGTQRDVYAPGYEWIQHSMAPKPPMHEPPSIRIGGADCTRPYEASLLNVSAMSFGSLSSAAIRALNGGAAIGGFYHNTGEGGISPHHLEPGGDLCWQVGTGYFGCRNHDGSFNPDKFAEQARLEAVKMIEIKLSQGAKPGHGGILPAVKITPEIAAIRDVPLGQDVISPPAHSTFDTPRGLLEFIAKLRRLSGGKPVGFKLCLGSPSEFLGLCMAMHETQMLPDFITVDGGEGGTGAAPLEFTNSIGAPLTEGLILINNALIGFNLRPRIRIIVSGKIMTGFHMFARLAAGADLCNAARAFMFALGCIQARRCNANVCPVGVTTQDPHLVRGLDITDKRARVANFHKATVHAFLEMLGAAGLSHPNQLTPWHVQRRISRAKILSYAEIYLMLKPGELLKPPYPDRYVSWMEMATPDSFTMQCRLPVRA